MDDTLTTEIVKIDTNKKTIELLKNNDETWIYAYKHWEISKEIELFLDIRQKDGWKPIAFATFKRETFFLTLTEISL